MNNLIKYCRYYKGEEECPESIKRQHNQSLWYYEQVWATVEMHRDENGGDVLGYIHYGLQDFNADDGTPITLKALLFNRYCHWSGGYGNDAENFKKWYLKYYLNNDTSDFQIG